MRSTRETDGNPLFVGEVVRLLDADGAPRASPARDLRDPARASAA